ncbi:MAG: molybdopterin converting factor subunit 1 [Gammaproteobacteria bacterium]|nr:molybdopterin converting factor subunit 1 [Gammaproteobacteria bacterium]
MIDVLYFASLREQLATAKEQYEADDGVTSIGELKQQLAQRGGAWSELFTQDQGLLCSVNQEMASEDTAIKSGDEVAFFPPVTGG